MRSTSIYKIVVQKVHGMQFTHENGFFCFAFLRAVSKTFISNAGNKKKMIY